MIIRRRIIPGDFLDSYVYENMLILSTGDNRLACASFEDSFDRTDDCVIHFLEKNARFQEMDQFITDLDVYKGTIYFCNSDGVFSLKLSAVGRASEKPGVSKIWDAPVQCNKKGKNGRIALSASGDGLFEYDTDENIELINMGNIVEHNIHQITGNHSTYCRWSNGNLWNSSIAGKNSFYEYNNYNNRSSKGKTTKIWFVDEHAEEEIFPERKNSGVVFMQENANSIFRLEAGNLRMVRYSQPNSSKIKFSEAKTVPILIPEEQATECSRMAFSKLKIPDAYVIETSSGLYVVQENGKTLYSSKPNDLVVGWRVFQRSRKHNNHLHIVFEDRVEIISFEEAHE